MHPALRLLRLAVVAGVALAVGAALLAPAARAVFAAGRPGKGENLVAMTELSQRSLVFARDGTLMAALHAEENRSPVALEQVPPHVVDAILDVEDDRFWQHGGVNLVSTMRALLTNVSAGGVRQGGSTITQQLVKNALLTPEKSVDRKVKEAVLAMRLERALDKREILERYLNTVYFGNGAYGVQAAAETYFGRSAEALSPGQAALLAGIIRNPVRYDPVRFPEAAAARRELAVERMLLNGHLTPEEADRIRREPLPRRLVAPAPPPNDYFVEEVKQRLLDDRRLGETPQERYNAVFKGGLKIFTTFDPRMQRIAQDRVRELLPNTKGRFAAALATVEPGTGAVRAIVAGDDFNVEKYNLATQGKRQPGSSFKTFVLLAALEAGYNVRDTIDGTTNCTLPIPGQEPYSPGNYEDEGGGVMSLTDATVHSVNCAYVRLGLVVGLDRVVDIAARLGIPRNRLNPYPSISLGAQEATPLEMAAAYAAVANDGVYHAPRFVEKVLDRHGRVVFQGGEPGRRAMSAQTARVATQVLRQVLLRGTGRRAELDDRPAAGKTGTSQNHENAWFVGFTPQLSTAVWMGAPEGNVPMLRIGSVGKVVGGSYPALMWRAFMEDALRGQPPLKFVEPSDRQQSKPKFIKETFTKSSSKAKSPPKRRSRPPSSTPRPAGEGTATTNPPLVEVVPAPSSPASTAPAPSSSESTADTRPPRP